MRKIKFSIYTTLFIFFIINYFVYKIFTNGPQANIIYFILLSLLGFIEITLFFLLGSTLNERNKLAESSFLFALIYMNISRIITQSSPLINDLVLSNIFIHVIIGLARVSFMIATLTYIFYSLKNKNIYLILAAIFTFISSITIYLEIDSTINVYIRYIIIFFIFIYSIFNNKVVKDSIGSDDNKTIESENK